MTPVVHPRRVWASNIFISLALFSLLRGATFQRRSGDVTFIVLWRRPARTRHSIHLKTPPTSPSRNTTPDDLFLSGQAAADVIRATRLMCVCVCVQIYLLSSTKHLEVLALRNQRDIRDSRLDFAETRDHADSLVETEIAGCCAARSITAAEPREFRAIARPS